MIHIFWGKNGMYEITRPVAGGSWSAATRLDAVHQGGWFVSAKKDASSGIYMM